MNILISIVSHGHQALLLENDLLAKLSPLGILVRENIPEKERLVSGEAEYAMNLRRCGFGANHNKNFELAHLEADDWFVICNPDILATRDQVLDLLSRAENEGEKLVAPMLWNGHKNSFDHNIRPHVKLYSLALSFAGLPGPSRYQDEELSTLKYADWASGAFLAIKAGLFRELNGFDERYFMYMEDVDLCRRAEDQGVQVRYFDDIRMIHYAARDNRKAFSANFAYHIRSVIRYFFF